MPSPNRPEDAWRFPPPEVGRGWGVLAMLASLAALAVCAASLSSLATTAGSKVPGVIDDDRVVAVVARSCAEMRAEVTGRPARGPAEARAQAIADQNGAIERLIDEVEDVDADVRAADRPLDAWLADWDAVLVARQKYARDVFTGSREPFDAPTAPDGAPVTERIEAAADGACDVPAMILDPAAGSDRFV